MYKLLGSENERVEGDCKKISVIKQCTLTRPSTTTLAIAKTKKGKQCKETELLSFFFF
jgi:hypothetical protein